MPVDLRPVLNMRAKSSVAVLLTMTVIWLSCMKAPSALTCKCSPHSCDPVSELECPSGLTLDQCGCCKVCAKSKNESCKGPFGVLGECGEGLRCVLEVIPGSPISGQEKGTCQEATDCSLKKYYGCNAVQKTCFCEEVEACEEPHFQFDTQLECEYSLAKTVDCEGIKCVKDDVLCPDDSYKLPSIQKVGECCSTPQRCECLPLTKCEIPTCKENLVRKLIHPEQGIPGSCCPVYQCVNVTAITCTYQGNIYNNHDQWEDTTKCLSCSCEDGLTMCEVLKCDSSPVDCGLKTIPLGECCPVCIGCITSYGFIYNNSDEWKEEGDCVTCTCEQGQVNCQAALCQVTCKNPIPVAGQCCDECPEPTLITLPEGCPKLAHCEKQCEHGLRKDKNGCYICECSSTVEQCDLVCPQGFVKDHQGAPLCKCLPDIGTAVTNCPPFHCKKKCLNGYRLDDKGCQQCKCSQCKKPEGCFKHCENGYKIDRAGCIICECKRGKNWNSSTELSVEYCRTPDGVRHPPHDSWHDGCRNCICLDGREMCSLITCPVPHCKHPSVNKGECCPKCIEDIQTAVSKKGNQANLSVCEAVYGHRYLEGETWYIDSCTFCTCHEGRVLCESQQCPPAPCENHIQGNCCSSCSDSSLPSLSVSQRPCFSDDNRTVYQHGEKWRASTCQSCICQDGKFQCFSETCPKLTCSRPLLPKNRCCPICPEKPSVSHCSYNGNIYSTGEQWDPNECMHCECLNGLIKCIEIQCSKICANPIKIPGHCCPKCAGIKLDNTISQPDAPFSTIQNSNNNQSTESIPPSLSATYYILIIAVCGVIVFFIALTCCVMMFCWYKHHQASCEKACAVQMIHHKRPTSMNLDYQGINGNTCLKSTMLKMPDNIDYKLISCNPNRFGKSEKV